MSIRNVLILAVLAAATIACGDKDDSDYDLSASTDAAAETVSVEG